MSVRAMFLSEPVAYHRNRESNRSEVDHVSTNLENIHSISKHEFRTTKQKLQVICSIGHKELRIKNLDGELAIEFVVFENFNQSRQ